MQRLRNLFLTGCILSLSLSIHAQEQPSDSLETGTLVINIQGLKNNNGKVFIGLYDSPESWQGKAKIVHSKNLAIVNCQAEWILENIPFGEYGIKFYHDENEDGKMNTNFLKMPKESFGFSNNVMGKFGPPDFEKAKFLFKSDHVSIEIKTN